MPRRITLRLIATQAEVDISTVSLALRNSPRVRPSTRDRIHKIATSLGYEPDAALAALVAYRNGVRASSYQSTLAWLDNWPAHGALRKIAAFNEYFLGAAERAAQFGYKLDEFFLRSTGLSPARVADILRARNIQGLIAAPQQHDGEKLNFDFTGFSAVALGYSLRPASLHVVTNHQFLSVTLAVDRLRALGYRRIGLFLHADWDNKVNHGYSAGFITAQKSFPEKDRLVPHLFEDAGVSADKFHAWVTRERPDAIITQGLHPELISFLKTIGLRVPRDIGLVDLSAPRDKPEISGVYQNNRLIGATAVDLIIGMLHRNERGLPGTIVYTLVDGVWQPGKSVRSHPPGRTRPKPPGIARIQ